jgi:excisionase family DNA binding protein
MKIYKITKASEYLGVSINTLKTLANRGKINSFKTSGSHRRFRQDDLDSYMGVEKEKQEKLTVIYARCSTAKQKENLERQKDRLRKHAENKGYKFILIDEMASGINEKRKGIHKLIKLCFEGKVERILIEYKDRLARFGYEYLDAIFKNLEITVEIVEAKEQKYEEELAEDIMKILTCYSARYYGRRGGRKKKNVEENQTIESNGI